MSTWGIKLTRIFICKFCPLPVIEEKGLIKGNFLYQVSFWIDNQSIPARTALGITTVLAMTTLLFGIQSSLPSVPYIKAVDLFMIVSFASVFAALIEFAVVNYTSMREKEKRKIRPAKNTYHVVSTTVY